ncbi:uncharacterized protein LOC132165861 [Corylus avellana]|uniref:uncharacterized protein LOC132165861 n=1 Tax=Corylus avellana TaxID=13451 RepID=UPI00286A90D9|nr:uncharacterized protein LOC132165861 [Corylus avellana]
MIFFATNPVDEFAKNMDIQGSCKNDSMSSSCMNGGEENPMPVLMMKLSSTHNKAKKPCKVIKEKADGKLFLTSSSAMNGVENKPSLVLRIKLPQTAHNKEKLSCNTISAPHQNNTAPKQTGSTNGGSSDKLHLDQELIELKLETTKRKLNQRYLEARNSKRKVQLLDLKDIPENLDNRPKRQYRR